MLSRRGLIASVAGLPLLGAAGARAAGQFEGRTIRVQFWAVATGS